MAALTERLRSIMKAAVPGLTEHGYRGWNGIGYRHPVAGYICGVFPQTGHVRLLFEYGQQLPDPARLLTGFGRQTKWMSLRKIDETLEREIAALVEAAIGFGVANKGRLSEFRGAARGTNPSPGDDRRDGRARKGRPSQ